MYKTKAIPKNDLPFKFRGFESGSGRSVYILTRPMTQNEALAIELYGYEHRHAVLQSGEAIEDAWVD